MWREFPLQRWIERLLQLGTRLLAFYELHCVQANPRGQYAINRGEVHKHAHHEPLLRDYHKFVPHAASKSKHEPTHALVAHIIVCILEAHGRSGRAIDKNDARVTSLRIVPPRFRARLSHRFERGRV